MTSSPLGRFVALAALLALTARAAPAENITTDFPATGRAVGPQDIMIISNTFASPDGFRRPVIAVNGQYPSPLIKAKKGDNFSLNVVNKLTDPTMLRQTSIHWHGIFQHRTAWADGAEGVTQCPIAQSGDSFRYRFTARQETGTYWYHSHFGTQYCDGLRGPLVIYDDKDPHRSLYDVDDENTVITLADWYHLQAPSIGLPALSQATLINGKGREPKGDDTAPLSIVNVQYGKRYRLRIVSLSCDPNYLFSIDGHNLTIIEADGQLTRPHTVESIRIFAGQRYSVVLKANQKPDNYWIRSVPNLGAAGLPEFANNSSGINSAILRYQGAPRVNPKTIPKPTLTELDESDLHALLNPAAPGGPDAKPFPVNLVPSFNDTTGIFAINGKSWETPHVPLMVQILNGIPADQVVPKESIHVLPRNRVIEVTIPALPQGGAPHPFHLHGHAFSVVKSAGAQKPNYVDPVRRDVVNTGSVGTEGVIIRFKTDNPGPWFIHCHIEFHLVAGLAVVFIEAPEDIPKNKPPPPAWSSLCPKFGSLEPSATSISLVTLTSKLTTTTPTPVITTAPATTSITRAISTGTASTRHADMELEAPEATATAEASGLLAGDAALDPVEN